MFCKGFTQQAQSKEKVMGKSSLFVEENGLSHAALEQGSCDNSVPKSAHRTDHDPWQQAALLLVTGFNCVYILGFSNLIMVPLGMLWGIIAMLLLGVFSLYANVLLSRLYVVDEHVFIRYRDLVGYALGKKMHFVVGALQILHFALSNMGFLLLSGKALKNICLEYSPEIPVKLGEFIIVSGAVYFIFAASVPHLSAMGIWSAISAALTSVYVVILVIFAAKDGNSSNTKNYDVSGSLQDKIFNGMGALSAIIFANNSGMLPEIQATLKKPAIKNMQKALYIQFTLGIGIYYGVTILGYWAYGSAVSEYVLHDISAPRWARVLSNSAAFLQTVISQHVFCVPVHEALDTRFCRLEEKEYSAYNVITRLVLRALFFTGSTLCAAMLPFIADFVGLVGSLAITPLTFLFPSMVFLKINGQKCDRREKLWHIFIIVFSVLMTVGSTAAALRLIFINSKTYHLFADA